MQHRARIPQGIGVRHRFAMFVLLGLAIGLTRPVQAQMINISSPLSTDDPV